MDPCTKSPTPSPMPHFSTHAPDSAHGHTQQVPQQRQTPTWPESHYQRPDRQDPSREDHAAPPEPHQADDPRDHNKRHDSPQEHDDAMWPLERRDRLHREVQPLDHQADQDDRPPESHEPDDNHTESHQAEHHLQHEDHADLQSPLDHLDCAHGPHHLPAHQAQQRVDQEQDVEHH